MNEGSTEPSVPAPSRRRPPSGCLLAGLALVAMMAFTVIVVVSLTLVGVIGGESSEDERREILAEIAEETGIATSSRDIDHPPQRDVRLGLCETADDGTMTTDGMLANPLDDAVDYTLTVSFHERSGTDLGVELSRVEVTVEAVPSEEEVDWSADSDVAAPDDFSCRVVRIERQAS